MNEGLEERKAEKVDTVAAGEGEAAAPAKRERRRVRKADATPAAEATPAAPAAEEAAE
jgi:hypothetical protein